VRDIMSSVIERERQLRSELKRVIEILIRDYKTDRKTSSKTGCSLNRRYFQKVRFSMISNIIIF